MEIDETNNVKCSHPYVKWMAQPGAFYELRCALCGEYAGMSSWISGTGGVFPNPFKDSVVKPPVRSFESGEETKE